ncbi:DUF2484 family protein [Cognatishimia sp. MH4019]|uniref:DUF2484 family protein n=1 Tax=Cognatishimia sp. MH4019 TaxID=2854030 RepID=UPI001CD7F61F|nr:DUF2484 family protein [Cognatishimia sp. MH4019]
MTYSLIAACLWLLIANIAAMIPSKDNHWSRAYALIAVGFPIVGWVWWEAGIWWALGVLIAGGWLLKWPVIYAWRWVKRTLGR